MKEVIKYYVEWPSDEIKIELIEIFKMIIQFCYISFSQYYQWLFQLILDHFYLPFSSSSSPISNEIFVKSKQLLIIISLSSLLPQRPLLLVCYFSF